MTHLQISSNNLNGKLLVGQKAYRYASLEQLDSMGDWRKLPYCLKILLENLCRNLDGTSVTQNDIQAIINVANGIDVSHEIAFRPARVLMQDFSGVPAIVDLAAMRDAMIAQNKDASKINPQIPVDLVIDHSVMIDHSGSSDALEKNVALEFSRNIERYKFLKWGTKTFENFRVVPPGVGICHQVNLEFLAKCVWTQQLHDDEFIAFPDTVVGTDSHTTMVNGLSVLGWGVGGIEAEAAMLGQPISMLIPKVLGVHLKGTLTAGCTATDLVLTITQILRKKGVVGMFVEYFGEGVDQLSLADRATVANMAPEYGATCGIFAIDDETLRYMALTGRTADEIELVEKYAKAQCLWRHADEKLSYNDVLEIDLSSIVPSLAGPKRPQDRLGLNEIKSAANTLIPCMPHEGDKNIDTINHHDVVLAAITSCTNTSNPAVLIAAGLVAKKARALGIKSKPWVKTSFAPGSQVVKDYLEKAGLMQDLESLGFHLVGYGCTSCIGNSGPLNPSIVHQIESKNLTVSGVLSGNRNFEGRIHPYIKANYLASPPLVVAFALAGTTHIDLTTEPLTQTADGKAIYLKDVWPTHAEIQEIMDQSVTADLFQKRYSSVFDGDENWRKIDVVSSQVYNWDSNSTYIQNPPYFREMSDDSLTGGLITGMSALQIGNVKGARILALLGDSITTDHISPAGSIKVNGPAGLFLSNLGVSFEDFNSYGSRRGNHEIMIRGTFANIRLQNEQVPERTGGYTRNYDSTSFEPVSIFDAALQYMKKNRPLVIFAGREYGTGSSRDWAAKGVRLLGVSAVIAESFERIHRSNLVGMGVLPLVFEAGVTRKTLGLVGDELIDIDGFDNKGTITPGMKLTVRIHKSDGTSQSINVICRVDTADEVEYMNAGGILQYVVQQQA